MCPHPLASLDCALVLALFAVPGSLAALVFAVSAVLWQRRGQRSSARGALVVAGAVPSSLAAAALVASLFSALDLFRSHLDKTLVFAAMLGLSIAVEGAYVWAVRPGGPSRPPHGV
jgi:hypothetical protein